MFDGETYYKWPFSIASLNYLGGIINQYDWNWDVPSRPALRVGAKKIDHRQILILCMIMYDHGQNQLSCTFFIFRFSIRLHWNSTFSAGEKRRWFGRFIIHRAAQAARGEREVGALGCLRGGKWKPQLLFGYNSFTYTICIYIYVYRQHYISIM